VKSRGKKKQKTALEPVAAIGHPPTKDADGNGGQQRHMIGNVKSAISPSVTKMPQKTLRSISSILARDALRPPGAAQVSRKNILAGEDGAGK